MNTLPPRYATARNTCTDNTISRRSHQSLTYSLVLAAWMALLLTGCSQDHPEPRFNQALNKKWATTSQVASPAWVFPPTGQSYTELVDFAKAYLACALDDYVVFYPEGKTTKFNATQKCDPAQPDKDTDGSYTYTAATDSLILNVFYNGQFVTFRTKLVELSSDRMVLRYQQPLPFSTDLYTITETYRAIP